MIETTTPAETPEPPVKLISAGTASDSPGIQLFETLSVGGFAAALGAVFVYWPIALVAISVSAGTTALALRARRKRIEANEIEARFARYQFFKDRELTIDGLPVPDDVKIAIKGMVTDKTLTRFEVAQKLKIRIGETRASQFLPVALQQADRSLVPKTDEKETTSAPPSASSSPPVEKR